MTRFACTAVLALLPAALFARQAGTPTDLLEATRNNDIVRVLHLLEGADIDAAGTNGMTALHVAAGFGYPELTRILIEHGASLNVVAALGKTPLMLAAQEGHTEISDLLIDAGARTDLRDNTGATALTWARGNGHQAIVATLQPVDAPASIPIAPWQWWAGGVLAICGGGALGRRCVGARKNSRHITLSHAA